MGLPVFKIINLYHDAKGINCTHGHDDVVGVRHDGWGAGEKAAGYDVG